MRMIEEKKIVYEKVLCIYINLKKLKYCQFSDGLVGEKLGLLMGYKNKVKV